MKRTKMNLKFAFIGFLLLTSASCTGIHWKIKGNGNIITQERDISGFNSILAGNGLSVFIIQGDKEALKIEADENLMDFIITKVKDNKLIIKTTKNIHSAKSKKVYVTVVSLKNIYVSSGCHLTSKDKFLSENLKINTSSGANLNMLIEATNISCSAGSGADLNLTVETTNISCSTGSGSNAYLKGRATNFSAKASSGANLKASELKADVCEATASSGGKASVHAINEIEASASSGGNIDYYGNPQKITTNTSSGGNINNVDKK